MDGLVWPGSWPCRITVVGVGGHASRRVRELAHHAAAVPAGGERCASIDFLTLDDQPEPKPHSRRSEHRLLERDVDRLDATTRAMLSRRFADTDLVILVIAAGGAFGSEIAPAVASLVRQSATECWAVATRPFDFEPLVVRERAAASLQVIHDQVAALLPVSSAAATPADRIPSLSELLDEIDGSVATVLQCLVRVLTEKTIIGLELTDIRTLLSDGGAVIGLHGVASGVRRANDAVAKALSVPGMRDLSFCSDSAMLLLLAQRGSDGFADEIEVVRRAFDAAARTELPCALWLGRARVDDTLEVSAVLAGIGTLGEWFEVDGRRIAPTWFDPVSAVDVDADVLEHALSVTAV